MANKAISLSIDLAPVLNFLSTLTQIVEIGNLHVNVDLKC